MRNCTANKVVGKICQKIWGSLLKITELESNMCIWLMIVQRKEFKTRILFTSKNTKEPNQKINSWLELQKIYMSFYRFLIKTNSIKMNNFSDCKIWLKNSSSKNLSRRKKRKINSKMKTTERRNLISKKFKNKKLWKKRKSK